MGDNHGGERNKMGCGGAEEKKEAEVVVAEEEPCEAASTRTIVIGVTATPETPNFKMVFEVNETTKVKHILKKANNVLAAFADWEGEEVDLEKLVPLWTDNWDPMDKGAMLIEALDELDAWSRDPVRLIGVDTDDFDCDYWNEYLEPESWNEFVTIDVDAGVVYYDSE